MVTNAEIDTPALDEVAELHQSLIDGGFEATKRNERLERHIDRVEARLRTAKARAIYLDYAMRSRSLSHREFRYLAARASFADPDLSNAFVSSRKAIAKRIGGRESRTRDGRPRGGLERIARLERSVSEKGWHKIGEDGTQFLIPAGVITPGHPGWPGPERWDKRSFDKRVHVGG